MTVFPEVQRKLRLSVLEALPEIQDRQPTFDDLTAAKLPYLEAVVQETLRLSRTAGGYSREGTLLTFYQINPSSLRSTLRLPNFSSILPTRQHSRPTFGRSVRLLSIH